MASTALTDYAPILAQRDTQGRPFVLVGGHAVNFWADFYRHRGARLDAFYPFLSKDLDLLATTEEGQRIAAATGWDFIPPEPDAIVMRGKLRQGPLLVELLRAQSRELLPPVEYDLAISGYSRPLTIRLLNPVVLLDKKLSLAVDVPQDGSLTGIAIRQDVRHVRMLGLIMPFYVADVLGGFSDDDARCAAVQPIISILASLQRGSTGRRFEAERPGAIAWHKLLPQSVSALPLDDVHRRCLNQIAPAATSEDVFPNTEGGSLQN